MKTKRSPFGNKKLWLALALLLPFGACNSCQKRTSPAPVKLSTYGWTADNNQKAKLTDYAGKVVVLDFYATWCEPCRDETPHLVQLQQQYGDRGLQVIGLNVGGADDREEVPGFKREFGIQYSLGFPDDEFAESFLGDNQNIPQSFVIDRSGRVVKRFIGYNDSIDRQLEEVVQDLLSR